MSLAIRPARTDDLDAVRDIVNWAIENTHYNFNLEPQSLAHWQAEYENGRDSYPWLVAEIDAAVIGVAYAGRYKLRRAYDWCAEVTVYISHLHHRRGVGTALYAEMLPILEAQGLHALLGVIALPNPGSVALHERFGFVDAGHTRQVGWKFGRWWDVGHWQKLLRYEDAPASSIVPVEDAMAAAKTKGRR